jgi:hypothetical protein
MFKMCIIGTPLFFSVFLGSVDERHPNIVIPRLFLYSQSKHFCPLVIIVTMWFEFSLHIPRLFYLFGSKLKSTVSLLYSIYHLYISCCGGLKKLVSFWIKCVDVEVTALRNSVTLMFLECTCALKIHSSEVCQFSKFDTLKI